MESKEQYSTWVEVDLEAMANNVRQMKARNASGEIMAVVKANGYGHGSIAAAQAALHAGAAWCGVARMEEALELRLAGLDCPILILGYTPPAGLELAIQQGISLTVWNEAQVQAAGQAALRLGASARLHLKVDTGMNRIGARPDGTADLAGQISRTKGMLLEGLFTHFARADEADLRFTCQQEQIFSEVIEALRSLGLLPKWLHAANSAAGLVHPPAGCNLTRMGISLYGLHPSDECQLPQEFRPALAWKTVLSQVKSVPAGQGVSYNHEYVTSRLERLGTLPVGYADGFRRARPNQALVGGVRAPVVGRVCMDQCVLQLDEVAGARAGDEVVLIGEQGQEMITAEEVAKRWGTINYEVVCAIGARVPRVYKKLITKKHEGR
jgi:alanine racemase